MIGSEPNGVVAVFSTAEQADAALEWMEKAGIDMRSVSVLGRGEDPAEKPPELDHGMRHSLEIARFWARWGAVTGAGMGAGTIGIPLIAFLIGAGPFALMLAAVAAATAATSGIGALTAALVGLGVHEAHALAYEHALRDGKVVVVVHTDQLEKLEDAKATLASQGPERLDVHGLRALRHA